MVARNYMGLTAIFFLVAEVLGANDQVYYVSLDHANATYFNPEYFSLLSAKSSRLSRKDPKYYVNIHAKQLKTMDNNVTVDIVFYEFSSNEYRRAFVEMHSRFCDLVQKDIFFGPALRASLPPCPVPPGSYEIKNLWIPDLPVLSTFPFRKGRIYVTFSAKTRVIEGYVDMEIKLKRVILVKLNNTDIVNKKL